MKCVRVKAITRHRSGPNVRLQEVMINAAWPHCFLQRKVLALKSLHSEIDCVMKSVLREVNSIKQKVSQTRVLRKNI